MSYRTSLQQIVSPCSPWRLRTLTGNLYSQSPATFFAGFFFFSGDKGAIDKHGAVSEIKPSAL